MHQFLGVEVIHTFSVLFLSQHNHITNLLARFDIVGAKTVATPMSSSKHFSLIDGSFIINAIALYRHIVGSL